MLFNYCIARVLTVLCLHRLFFVFILGSSTGVKAVGKRTGPYISHQPCLEHGASSTEYDFGYSILISGVQTILWTSMGKWKTFSLSYHKIDFYAFDFQLNLIWWDTIATAL